MGTAEKSLGLVVLFRGARRLLAWGALALLIYGAQHTYFQVPLVPVQPSCHGPDGAGAGQRELTGLPSRRFIGAFAVGFWAVVAGCIDQSLSGKPGAACCAGDSPVDRRRRAAGPFQLASFGGGRRGRVA